MTDVSEQSIRLSARLYECRDAARTLLGENYAIRIAEYGQLITRLARKEQITPLAAATRLGQALGGFGAVIALAAFVELVEPS